MRTGKFNWMFAAALLFGLSIAVTSCKDDDNDTNSTQKQEQEALEEASKFWTVVGQLVSVDDVTDEYEGKTFEPTIGLEDETNPLTRIVSTNDMQTAAQRFADLIDASDIDENTTTYTWNDPEIGTMTYTKGGTQENWATVDVNIKAVPHLKQIIYKVGGEGDNSTFNGGKAYYRFGDVISREVDVVFDEDNNDRRGTITEYWICVRPSFDPEGKGDSHWVCVNTVSDKNYKYWPGSNKTDYWVPYSLTTNKENMQNFAELLYAICYPEVWYQNVNYFHTDGSLFGFSGLPIFADFKKKYIQYHNQYFWQNVQKAWEKNKVAEKALNLPGLSNLIDKIRNDGVHLLYKGYHWLFRTSWNCELYEAIYTNGKESKEYNLHHLETKSHKRNMKDLKFDVREMGKTFDNYAAFFGNDGIYRWAIRYATGKELAKNGKYDPQQQINGVTDVYRYYRDVVPTTDLGEGPEITEKPTGKLETPVVGSVIGELGNFYENASYARQNNEEPKAIVVYVGGNKRVERGKNFNGLAIALKDTKDGNDLTYSQEGLEKHVCTHNAPSIGYVPYQLSGLQATAELVTDSHEHQAAKEVYAQFIPGNNNFSEWFIPSAGQWCLAMEGMGFGQLTEVGQFMGSKVYGFNGNGKWAWETAGLSGANLKEGAYYMSSTERNIAFPAQDGFSIGLWYFDFNQKQILYSRKSGYGSTFNVRPFMAFKYGNGGTVESDEPWKSVQEPVVNGGIGMDGKFYKKPEDAFAATGYAPAAYILYVDNGSYKTVKVDDTYYRGYAVALTARSSIEAQFIDVPWADLKSKAASVQTTLKDNVRQARGLSPWFVPSKQQWQKGIETAFGAEFNEDMGVVENKRGTTWQEYLFDVTFTDANILGAAFTAPFWTDTEVENDNSSVYVIDFTSSKNIKFHAVKKTDTHLNNVAVRLRPFIAF